MSICEFNNLMKHKYTKTIMDKILLLSFLTLLTTGLFGQSIKEIEMPDSLVENYFVVEPKGKVEGAMILLPGGSLSPESTFPETKLHNVAYLHNILVIAMGYGRNNIYLTDEALYKMNTVLVDVMNRYDIPKDKFVIGGFSGGGIISLNYTIHCKQFPEKAVIDPQGVFTADAPVDLTEVWYSLNREINKNFSEMAMNEARYFLPHIETDMNGTPETNPENYIKHSPYTHRAKDGGNVKYLLNVPVRLHHDIDIVWRLKNRRQDLFDMNDAWASAMINWLLLNGNDKAEFVVSDRSGRRSSGQWNTHSWSVIEEISCVLWAKECLGLK